MVGYSRRPYAPVSSGPEQPGKGCPPQAPMSWRFGAEIAEDSMAKRLAAFLPVSEAKVSLWQPVMLPGAAALPWPKGHGGALGK